MEWTRPLCLRGFSPGTLVSSYVPKMCTRSELLCLNCPNWSECGCVIASCDGCSVQDGCPPGPWAAGGGSSHRRPWTRSSGLENNALLCFYSSFLNASVAHIFSSVSYKWLGSLEVWWYFCNQKYAVGAYLLFITMSLWSNWFLDIFSLSRRFQEPMTTLSEDLFAGLEMQPPSYSTEASFPCSEETSRVLCPGRLHLGAGHTVKMYPAVHLRSMYFPVCMLYF